MCARNDLFTLETERRVPEDVCGVRGGGGVVGRKNKIKTAGVGAGRQKREIFDRFTIGVLLSSLCRMYPLNVSQKHCRSSPDKRRLRVSVYGTRLFVRHVCVLCRRVRFNIVTGARHRPSGRPTRDVRTSRVTPFRRRRGNRAVGFSSLLVVR